MRKQSAAVPNDYLDGSGLAWGRLVINQGALGLDSPVESHLRRWTEEEVRREEEDEVKDTVGECTSRIPPDIRDQVTRNKWDDEGGDRQTRQRRRILGLCKRMQLDEGGKQRARILTTGQHLGGGLG